MKIRYFNSIIKNLTKPNQNITNLDKPKHKLNFKTVKYLFVNFNISYKFKYQSHPHLFDIYITIP